MTKSSRHLAPLLLLLTLVSAGPTAHAQPRSCIGNDYEQGNPLEGSVRPAVEISAPVTMDELDQHLLQASATVDMGAGAEAFFYWCSDRGELTADPSSPDFRSVFFQTPSVPGTAENAKISVTVGDGLGYVITASRNIAVMEIGNHDPADPAPQVSVDRPASVLVDTPSSLRFEVSDLDTSGADSTPSARVELSLLDHAGLETPLIQGLPGTSGSWTWVPRSICSNCRILVTASDGNLATTAVSGIFHVTSEYSIAGSASGSSSTPLDAATILVDGVEAAQTNLDGVFHIAGAEPGRHTLQATKPGFDLTPVRAWVDLSAESSVGEVHFVVSDGGGGGGGGGGARIIAIDIKPGNEINPVNPQSRGKLPVGILGSNDLDPINGLVHTSLTFGRTGHEDSLHIKGNGLPNCSEKHLNTDDKMDLLCHFHTDIAAFQSSDTEGILRGLTTAGDLVEGRDHITIVGHAFDGDQDGVSDELENLAPNDGDGNGDGVLDSSQAAVSSLPSTASGSYLTLEASPPCVGENVRSLLPGSEEMPLDTLHFPEGLLGFNLTAPLGSCDHSTTRIFFHGQASFEVAEYRKYGRNAPGAEPEWASAVASFETLDIGSNPVAVATLELVDGGHGDGDGTVDGIISDPGGPGLPIATILEIPALSRTGKGLMAAMLLLLALYGFRLRSR